MEYNFKVSVIVPIYNVEKYIAECIESIIKQDYRNLEIILVDDGSPDKSGEICDFYKNKDERIIVIHKENAGVSAARNSGLDAATGDYVCFVDGDDYLEEDYVSYLLKQIVDNGTKISLSKGIYDTFTPKNNNADFIKVVSGEQAAIDILTYKIHIGVYCKMFELKFLNDNNIRFKENIRMGEGFNFNTYAFQKADKVSMGWKQIYFYRRNNIDSATTNFNRARWENGFFAIDQIEKDLCIDSESLKNAVKYARWHTYFDALCNAYIMNEHKTNKDFFKECLRNTKKGYKSAFKVDISKKDKLRALISKIAPLFIAKRNKKKLNKTFNGSLM